MSQEILSPDEQYKHDADRAVKLVQTRDQFSLYPFLKGGGIGSARDEYVGGQVVAALAALSAEGVVYREMVPDTNFDYPSIRGFVTVLAREGVETEAAGKLRQREQGRLRIWRIGQVASGAARLYTNEDDDKDRQVRVGEL